MRASLMAGAAMLVAWAGSCAAQGANEPAAAPAAPASAQSAPAAPKPAIAGVPLVNPGFESDRRGATGNPEGWEAVQHAGEIAYRFTLDTSVRHGGKKSLRIDNLRPEFYGSMTQAVPAAGLIGKTVRFSAWLKTENVKSHGFTRGATLTLHANLGDSPLASADFKRAAFGGTTDWARHEVVLTIPPRTATVEIGIMMTGSGKIWADDVTLEIIEPPS